MDSIEDYCPNPLRKRVCPKCGHRYLGTELCPKRENHYSRSSGHNFRDQNESQASIKEFLRASHRENTNMKDED